jgi:hypothetical protein
MIHKHKTVIASLRNKGNVRVFIPEKLRIAGVSYVQPYKFTRILLRRSPSLSPLVAWSLSHLDPDQRSGRYFSLLYSAYSLLSRPTL